MNPNPDPAPELPKTPRPEKNLEALTNQESPTAVPLLNDEVKLYKTDMEQDDQNIVLKAIVEVLYITSYRYFLHLKSIKKRDVIIIKKESL